MLLDALVIVGGVVLGSFLNVVIYRWPRGGSVVYPPSACVHCGHRLSPLDLVPIFSFLLLKGRCRYCKNRISLRYPLVELLTGLALALVYFDHGLTLLTAAGWLFAAILLVCAFIDIDAGIIPDRLTYPGLLAGIILSFFTIGIKTSLLGASLFALVYFIAAVVSKGGMGGGDIKLAAVIGAFTGIKGALLVFMLSALLAGLWAVILVLRGKAGRKTAIRFGPFLSLAAYLVWNWGEEILSAYLSIIY